MIIENRFIHFTGSSTKNDKISCCTIMNLSDILLNDLSYQVWLLKKNIRISLAYCFVRKGGLPVHHLPLRYAVSILRKIKKWFTQGKCIISSTSYTKKSIRNSAQKYKFKNIDQTHQFLPGRQTINQCFLIN